MVGAADALVASMTIVFDSSASLLAAPLSSARERFIAARSATSLLNLLRIFVSTASKLA